MKRFQLISDGETSTKGRLMRKRSAIVLAAFCVILFTSAVACLASPDMEWSISGQLTLEKPPLDVTTSLDGRWIFILTPGQVLVYSVEDKKVVDHFPVDPSLDRVAYSIKDNSLVLTGQSDRSLKILQMEFIQKFDVTGLPFKGPADAAVTVAVFSDYQ
jgi:hypothetical protein